MIVWNPQHFTPGDVIRIFHPIYWKPKYLLCIRSIGIDNPAFFLMGTGRETSLFRGQLQVDSKLLPIPPSKTGFSKFAIDIVESHSRTHLGTGVNFGPIGRTAAGQIANAWNEEMPRKAYTTGLWSEIRDMLASIDRQDPSSKEIRKLRNPALRAKLGQHDTVARIKAEALKRLPRTK